MIIVLASFGLYVFKKLNLENFWNGLDDIETLQCNDSVSEQASFDFIYIAHAGGGFQGKTYLNTLEAINNSVNLGVNFIELDFQYTIDSVVVLAHDVVTVGEKEFLSDRTMGTHLNLDQLLNWLKDKKVTLITDIKANNLIILKIISQRYPELMTRIIPQVYFISEIDEVKMLGFDRIIFTNYRAAYPNMIIKQLADCHTLFAITLPYGINFKLFRFSYDIKSLSTPILLHTINDPEIIDKCIDMGVNGVYTDFSLFPSK